MHYTASQQRWDERHDPVVRSEYPAQALLVRYEDLTRDPDQAMAWVLAHLDLPTVPAVAVTAQEARDIVAHPHLGNVLGAVSGDFIGKGRARLPHETKVAIAEALQRGFGYELTGEPG